MKELKCKNCGAHLPLAKVSKCDYCGSTFILKDDGLKSPITSKVWVGETICVTGGFGNKRLVSFQSARN